MKKLLLIATFFSIVMLAKAQEPTFIEGKKLLNVGIGLGYYKTYNAAVDFSASYDYCVSDGIIDKGSIGVGPFAGVGFGWGYNTKIQPFGGARGTFHYPIVEKLDTYAGLALGLRLYNSIHLIGGFFVGANYPITENIAVFGELGSGSTCAGISFRID